MAVSFRVTGTWAELTADGTVAIPATPQAGDRMYLYARWKDFSVTATVADWIAVPGTPFADGAISAGNGSGSVKVGCWYRDWESGDTDPTIDFSASPDNASAVITVMAKDAADSWLTPVAVTAAMTNWTTTSQIVSASSTANVLGGGVVMGLIGLRDDSATMTRPTTGIDDSAAAVTWNGNYVESPATHHSTTTGFDGAADLGYRLVTAGATATLRMTGTISAAETGAALWVVQGVEANLIVQDSAHAASAGNVLLSQDHLLALASATHAQTAANSVLTQDHVLVVGNGGHAHSVENVVFTQAHVLVTQNANHAHLSDNLVLEVIHHLVIGDAAHAHTVEGLILTQVHEISIANATHEHTAQSPNVRTFLPVFIDPGGDAVQVVGYFNSLIGGTVTFDTAQKVVGVGSWKFDSGAGNDASRVSVNGVLGANRRGSFYFRYDSVPDTEASLTKFAESFAEVYSGAGLTDVPAGIQSDDGTYAFATPARNAGQGTVFGSFGFDSIPDGAIIDSVKIIYERKYDTADSIGISRVKYRIDGVEGPDHDNTDEPLTDTVVEVDVTGDRHWERQDLIDSVSEVPVFQVIAEARRGDTDTEHTQSWDYVKVEVTYHTAVQIWEALDSTNTQMFTLAVLPFGDGVCIRFIDGAANSYDGITELAINTQHRIGYAFTNPDGIADDLHIKVYVDSIPELDISEASTNGMVEPVNLRHGWCNPPGASKSCWIDQDYIDDGDALTDVGNKLSTAKLGATVNNDNFDTTGGTGAVNERPVDLANYRQQAATAQLDQDYTIQAASVGDVDISGEILVGHMGWLIAKKSGFAGTFGFILDGSVTTLLLTTTAALVKRAVKSTSYPSNAAGIGLRSATASNDAFLLECGIVIAYEGPVVNAPLFPFQILMEDSVTPLTDDLRADPPDTYELLLEVSESNAQVSCEVYAITFEGQEPQYRDTLYSGGGSARVPIHNPGIEISLVIRVTGGNAYAGLRRRLNV